MADKKSKEVVLRGEEALALYRKGKDAWNKWAEDNPGVKVSFKGVEFKHAIFAGFVFPGDADFTNATFIGNAWFDDATFSGDAWFIDATFSGDVSFRKATFNGSAYFRFATFRKDVLFDLATFSGKKTTFHGATFGEDVLFWNVVFSGVVKLGSTIFFGMANFSDGDFGSSVDLTKAKFAKVPDFRRTKLSAHFDPKGITVDFMEDKNGERFMGFLCKKAADMEDAGRLCRLKELASIAKDHKREQDFFALELKAERFHETTGVRLFLGYAYQWLSDFGRSVARPVAGLAITWLLSGIYFACLSCSDPVAGIGKGLTTSTSLIFPFLGISRASLKEGFEGFDMAMAFAESLLGVMFLFLIGLALRNRFRI